MNEHAQLQFVQNNLMEILELLVEPGFVDQFAFSVSHRSGQNVGVGVRFRIGAWVNKIVFIIGLITVVIFSNFSNMNCS